MAVRHADDHYAADAPVEELRTAELLLVATLRLYALQYRDPAGDHSDWRDAVGSDPDLNTVNVTNRGFRAAAIAECAVPAFNALFNIISVAALRPLDVRCPHCRFLGEDEANFLLLEGLLQRAQTDAAAAILAGWLPNSAAYMAMLPAQGLAGAMMRGGLIVPVWKINPEVPQREQRVSAYADRGLALLQ